MVRLLILIGHPYWSGVCLDVDLETNTQKIHMFIFDWTCAQNL